MVKEESAPYFILADNMIHIVKNGIRLCTGESDSNQKYDPSANLFATHCAKCQN